MVKIQTAIYPTVFFLFRKLKYFLTKWSTCKTTFTFTLSGKDPNLYINLGSQLFSQTVKVKVIYLIFSLVTIPTAIYPTSVSENEIENESGLPAEPLSLSLVNIHLGSQLLSQKVKVICFAEQLSHSL